MKSLRWRLTLWFAISLLLVVGVLMVAAHWHLDYELRQEKWERTHPAHPDWILHGSFTDQEVHDILGELAQFWMVVALPVVGLAIVAAHFIARRSMRPVQQINQQLQRLGIRTLAESVTAPDADPEIGELVSHLNELLARLQTSFTHLREYTGQVAHELRTPLQLMRLQVEANAADMKPELAEELQEELARLSNYVEAALTIAHAEQGRLELNPGSIPLKEFLADILEPFTRLAEADGRKLLWSCPDGVIAWSDRAAFKQILFNLLNNALRYGAGPLHFRARMRFGKVVILVGNQVSTDLPRPEPGLGIGLRLVGALTRQLPDTSIYHRCAAFFWSKLTLPVAATAASYAPAGTAHDQDGERNWVDCA